MQSTQPPRERLRRRLRFVESDVTIPLAAAQSASLPKSEGTKKTLLERFPALKLVIREWNQWHEEARAKDGDVSYDNVRHTFNQMLKRRRSDLEEGGMHNALPDKVSTGWFYKIKAQVGVKDIAVVSRELRHAKFIEELGKVRADRKVDALSIMVFDETNGLFFPEVRRVQATPSEVKGKKQPKARRRCRRRLGGRESFTVCVVYSLGSKGKLLSYPLAWRLLL